ncbi:MAG: acyl carrier protein [Alphaproteobacteria bacterium]|nr:acyl carrier protein [Alphaproteobacteria bacterium]
MPNDIEKKVLSIVGEALGFGSDEISKDSKFIGDLGADSLDLVELIMALENEFGIQIPDEQAEKIETVEDAVLYISQAKR